MTKLLRVIALLLALLPASALGQLVSLADEQAMRASFPRVDDADIQKVLDGPLLIYTEREMPPAYQHNGSFHWTRNNISADATEAAKGHDRGGNGNIEFPWREPGGTDAARNVRHFKFIRLPKRDTNEQWPVVWWRSSLPTVATRITNPSGTRVVWKTEPGLRWVFPAGTVVGECLAMEGPDGLYHTFEVRTRTRELGSWAPSVFRPFPTSDDLVNRIKQLRPSWRDDPALVLAVALIERAPIRAMKIRDTAHPRRFFEARSGVVSLPPLPVNLVSELLDSTQFRSSFGEPWRDDAKATVYSPTARGWNIVPIGYTATYLGEDCASCHKDTLAHVDTIDPERDWYGHIRGGDRIFSFHPIDPVTISKKGFNTRYRLNPRLVSAKIIAPFNSQRHPRTIYRRLQ